VIDVRRNTSSNFYVGMIAADVPDNIADGHVRLGHDLTTTGQVRVAGGSSLDVAGHTIQTNSFAALSGARLAYQYGLDAGVIDVIGDLTLDAFTLDLVRTGQINDGADVVLFTYGGSLIGTPTLTLG